MLSFSSSDLHAAPEMAAAGEVLRQRQQQLTSVLHLESGRVVLGVREDGHMRHQLGVVEGPFWLDAASALLGLPSAVDMVAETSVRLRRQPLEVFLHEVQMLPASTQMLLRDMASGYRQQTELAVSRLAQDAEARCAQWLLQHAQRDAQGHASVTLCQRKRLIAAQLGIAPETFSRVLRNLRESGLIKGTGAVLQLPLPEILQQVAGR
ncbi:Crp/Fnr family transcriptional regulator [Acidovorax sp. SRB_14]|uniref:Crp/Fnr family transcriptional regulator n=1 Tax=unclassified Acidovorax TaxID=2684926 RepID=UPI00145E8163|nr:MULTISPECIES: Crp/Fnr family transcriptional regulator [unclassified Acidovorax]NMM76887.1 Crp/Fnr family transcriptional regulator [Acidovorax sp. SRB_24]NMM79957.1 Crp/Fnr family transcriptional regulator [Acidovorax sp. SRB_14]NMM87337.1 Crp/Fnr family transcriptional regulator [Rhodococcus sp. SRB_17]